MFAIIMTTLSASRPKILRMSDDEWNRCNARWELPEVKNDEETAFPYDEIYFQFHNYARDEGLKFLTNKLETYHIDDEDHDGNTALMWASRYGSKRGGTDRAISLLIERGADVNNRNRFNETALTYMIYQCDFGHKKLSKSFKKIAHRMYETAGSVADIDDMSHHSGFRTILFNSVDREDLDDTKFLFGTWREC